MSKFTIALAEESDDTALKKIIQDNPMDGRIKLAFKREPNIFHSISILGNENQVLVAREKSSGQPVGFAVRSIRRAFINGRVKDIGYLSGVRLNKEYRNLTILGRGIRFLEKLHKDGKVPFYYGLITADNRRALSILTSRRAGLPICRDLGECRTFAVGFSSRARPANCAGIKIARGKSENTSELAAFINAEMAKKQFAPYYSAKDYLTNRRLLRGFRINDFYIARNKNGRIMGALAKWDQHTYKQNVITGYCGVQRYIRPFYNLMAGITHRPRLPKIGEEFNSFFISLIAISENDRGVFSALLDAVYNDNRKKHYHYFLAGLHSDDPLISVLEKLPHIMYRSNLFVIYWNEDAREFASLDLRQPHIEPAIL